jgi:hypothetical protein
MLTDQSRAPFTIETYFINAENPPWDNSYWSWRLIGSDGVCLETGAGYTTEGEARHIALAISKNYMA